MIDDKRLARTARSVAGRLLEAGAVLATAESCTGGWIAKALTDIPGSSAWFAGGVVSYSNAAKSRLLGVSEATLACHGAVSEATVREMADGARQLFGVGHAVAVSGIAGPEGGSADKPVGTVWIAWAEAGEVRASVFLFEGDRESVRLQAVLAALRGVLAP